MENIKNHHAKKHEKIQKSKAKNKSDVILFDKLKGKLGCRWEKFCLFCFFSLDFQSTNATRQKPIIAIFDRPTGRNKGIIFII